MQTILGGDEISLGTKIFSEVVHPFGRDPYVVELVTGMFPRRVSKGLTGLRGPEFERDDLRHLPTPK